MVRRIADTEMMKSAPQCLRQAFGQRFRGVVVYGSQARGQATSESDIDLLVLLDEPISLGKDLEIIIRALYPLQLDLEIPIHALPVSMEQWRRGDFALIGMHAGTVCSYDPRSVRSVAAR
jgi:predicted nucleotidyltransferase